MHSPLRLSEPRRRVVVGWEGLPVRLSVIEPPEYMEELSNHDDVIPECFKIGQYRCSRDDKDKGGDDDGVKLSLGQNNKNRPCSTLNSFRESRQRSRRQHEPHFTSVHYPFHTTTLEARLLNSTDREQ